jgi:hypothetical protein
MQSFCTALLKWSMKWNHSRHSKEHTDHSMPLQSLHILLTFLGGNHNVICSTCHNSRMGMYLRRETSGHQLLQSCWHKSNSINQLFSAKIKSQNMTASYMGLYSTQCCCCFYWVLLLVPFFFFSTYFPKNESMLIKSPVCLSLYRSVCVSICPSLITPEPLGKFSWDLVRR